MKISQVKTNLQTIITNLSQLQTYRDSLTQDNLIIESEKIAKCKMNLEKAFNILESEQIDKVVAKLKQRKTKRIRRTKKVKALKVVQKSSKNVTQFELPYRAQEPEQQPINSLMKRKAKDAKKYIAFMESLETLHKLRHGDERCKLNQSLSSIRSVWVSTARMIKEELHQPSTEAQWRRVLFGDNSKVTVQHGVKDFIERRCVWDSYIVADDDSSGSCIPIGWVCPRENARSDWMQYRV